MVVYQNKPHCVAENHMNKKIYIINPLYVVCWNVDPGETQYVSYCVSYTSRRKVNLRICIKLEYFVIYKFLELN